MSLDHVLVLLQAGAQTAAYDEKSATPLIYAAQESNDPLVIRALIQAGSPVNYGMLKPYLFQQEQTGVTALMAAAVHNSNAEIIRELLRAGADPNVQTSPDSFTALVGAVVNNPSVDVVRALLEARADPMHIIDGHGLTGRA